MDSISISTGKVTIPVERDGEKVGSISFNPHDAVFAEKYQRLIQAIGEKQKEIKEMDSIGPDEFVKVCDFIKEQIDTVFGVGTSQVLFGDACSLEMFNGFFKGIAPIFTAARTEKVKKYME